MKQTDSNLLAEGRHQIGAGLPDLHSHRPGWWAAVIILIVGAVNPTIWACPAHGTASAWCSPACSAPAATPPVQLTFGFNPTNMGNMLFRATPLILTGLSVAVAFKTGLFNIGAPGQYLMGTAATLMLALGIPSDSRARLADLDHRLPGRHAGGRPVGRHPRPGQGLPQHQRGAGLHHDQLDRRQPGDLDVRHQQLQATWWRTPRAATSTRPPSTAWPPPKLGLDKLFPGSQVNGGILVAIRHGHRSCTSS